MENKDKSFEELMAEFESVIRNLENRDISLDDAVKNYTKGVDKNEKLVVEKMTENGLVKFEE